MKKSTAIIWKNGKPEGTIEVLNGVLEKSTITVGLGNCENGKFNFLSDGACRLEIIVDGASCESGADPTVVTINSKINPFSFFLRDVCKDYPIYIPAYNVAVTEADDLRYYEKIEDGIRKKGLLTTLQHIDLEQEETYETALKYTRKMNYCPTWLGLGRDIRIFEIDFPGVAHSVIKPRFHGVDVTLPECSNSVIQYEFAVGRGCGCVLDVTKRLEEGALPILHGKLIDNDISYEVTAFVMHESGELNKESLRGTHFLVADEYCAGHMFTEEQEIRKNILLDTEMKRMDETVLCCRVEAVNTTSVPRYAWFKSIHPCAADGQSIKTCYDKATGFSIYESGRVFCITRYNGNPVSQEEAAVLIRPGEKAVFEFFLPHRPISRERSFNLAAKDFNKLLGICREFWKQKLESCAAVKIPEKTIDEMVRAGILHLDLVSYGIEPDETVAPTIGVYPPIGSESAPIVQFMDSMGWHDLARRSLMYFIEKQHEDGFIQNFYSYMLETGAALWSIGEHYRYTLDIEWVKQIKFQLLKACDYILKWIETNKTEDLRELCYGLIQGKVADPEDPYHAFMLNGYAYLGLSRTAEMLVEIEPAESDRIRNAAEELKNNIRLAFFKAMAKSPVVPLNDGSWCPTVPPWPEYRGPVALYAQGGLWYTHGSFLVRDSILGPNWLVYQEIIEPEEPSVEFLLNYHSDIMHSRNVAFMQPYYSPHPWIHLKRGEVKQFLKAYYNEFVSLADRETYSFWECYFYCTPHKTHEEGWFLMRTRWMLYIEEGRTLKLMQGIPRAWMENGKRIEVKNAISYFGKISVCVESKLETGLIKAAIECNSDRKPSRIEIRLPHPQCRKALKVVGGHYNAEKETVVVENFEGLAEVTLEF